MLAGSVNPGSLSLWPSSRSPSWLCGLGPSLREMRALLLGLYTHSMPWERQRSHDGMWPEHRAFRLWQLMQACRTRRRGRAPDKAPVSPSSYEQGKPSRSQLEHMSRAPLHRTLRARQVVQVKDDFLGLRSGELA